jgi:dihydrofolate reductase
MRRLMVFNQVTLDGYFTDTQRDMSWAHKSDDEWNAFVAGNASSGGELLFGRKTYDLMVSHWPTPEAARQNPVVAEEMNNLPKVVFSRTLDKATWKNTRLLKGDLVAETRKLKSEPGDNLVILGSGSIVAQLAPAKVIDEYQIVVNPLVLGRGRTLFDGIKERLSLERTNTRTFGNGNVLLCYEPAG